MILVETARVEKSPDELQRDRHAGLVLVFVVFALVVGAVVVGMRRLRSRVAEERAERALRERIDHLEDAP